MRTMATFCEAFAALVFSALGGPWIFWPMAGMLALGGLVWLMVWVFNRPRGRRAG